jgi:hypothetical protein
VRQSVGIHGVLVDVLVKQAQVEAQVAAHSNEWQLSAVGALTHRLFAEPEVLGGFGWGEQTARHQRRPVVRAQASISPRSQSTHRPFATAGSGKGNGLRSS